MNKGWKKELRSKEKGCVVFFSKWLSIFKSTYLTYIQIKAMGHELSS